MQKDSQMSQDPSQPSDGIEILVPKASEPPATYLATGSPLTLQRDSEDAQTEEVDPKEPLEPFDWDALEERYHVKMQECQQTEEGIYADFATWIKVIGQQSCGGLRLSVVNDSRCLRPGRALQLPMRMRDLTKGLY